MLLISSSAAAHTLLLLTLCPTLSLAYVRSSMAAAAAPAAAAGAGSKRAHPALDALHRYSVAFHAAKPAAMAKVSAAAAAGALADGAEAAAAAGVQQDAFVYTLPVYRRICRAVELAKSTDGFDPVALLMLRKFKGIADKYKEVLGDFGRCAGCQKPMDEGPLRCSEVLTDDECEDRDSDSSAVRLAQSFGCDAGYCDTACRDTFGVLHLPECCDGAHGLIADCELAASNNIGLSATDAAIQTLFMRVLKEELCITASEPAAKRRRTAK